MKSLHWDITNKCNLRCKHCYNADKYFNKESVDFSPDELSLEESLKIVELIAQNGFERIHFLGGEPLASPNLFSVIKRAKEFGMLITMNSNATLLSPDVQEKLIDLQVDHFAASIDGTTIETNDRIRGKGTFKIVCENMRQLNERINNVNSSMQTALVSTITKANYKEIKELPQLAADVGCKLISLTSFVESGNGIKSKDFFSSSCKILFDAIEDMVSNELVQFDNLYLQLDMRPLVVEYLLGKYDTKILYNPYNAWCCAGEDIWYLEADGNVHPCLVYRLQPGLNAQSRGIFQSQKLKLGYLSIQDVEESKYWCDFLTYKYNFNHGLLSTCSGCNYQSICMPCPFEFGEFKTINDECEWVLSRINEDKENYMGKSFLIDDTLEVIENNLYVNGKMVLTANEMALYILKLIENGNPFEQIISIMETEFDVDRKCVNRDIVFLLNYFCSRKIIKVCSRGI